RDEVAEAVVEVVQNESGQEGEQGNQSNQSNAPTDSQTDTQEEPIHDTQGSPNSYTSSAHSEHATPEVPDNDATQVVEHYGEETHQQE
ncbi:MAG TPA: hypothetical protein DHW02_16940, partial [Ktedonobacter sp.]|nr:hypothetical protein [Ktedonobacter sp.]